MLSVTYSPRALCDMHAISDFLTKHSPDAAYRWLDGLDDLLKLVAKFPNMGQAVDELGEGVRRVIYGRYLVFCRAPASRIELVRVIHASRRLDDLDQ